MLWSIECTNVAKYDTMNYCKSIQDIGHKYYCTNIYIYIDYRACLLDYLMHRDRLRSMRSHTLNDLSIGTYNDINRENRSIDDLSNGTYNDINCENRSIDAKQAITTKWKIWATRDTNDTVGDKIEHTHSLAARLCFSWLSMVEISL